MFNNLLQKVTIKNKPFYITKEFTYGEAFYGYFKDNVSIKLGKFCKFTGQLENHTINDMKVLPIEVSHTQKYTSKNKVEERTYCLFIIEPEKFLEREIRFNKQREEKGFDDSELWNLDVVLAEIIISRLKAFKNIHNTSWQSIDGKTDINPNEYIDKMIKTFEFYTKSYQEKEKINENEIQLGWFLFIKYFGHLWY